MSLPNMSRAGLTLIELLVALALLALIGTTLATALRLNQSVDQRLELVEEVTPEIALRLRLRHWLMLAEPPNERSRFDSKFIGTVDGFRFLTFAETPHEPEAAALIVSIHTTGKMLAMSLEYLDDAGEVQQTEIRELAMDVSETSFRFFDARQQIWRTDWYSVDRLPSLIKIDVAQGSTPDWPLFIVQPRLGQR